MGRLLVAGAAVPDLRLAVLGGGEVSLRDEGAVLLAFFKISCPVCQFTQRDPRVAAQVSDELPDVPG